MAAPQVVGIEHVSGDGGVELKYFTDGTEPHRFEFRLLLEAPMEFHELSLVAGGVNIE